MVHSLNKLYIAMKRIYLLFTIISAILVTSCSEEAVFSSSPDYRLEFSSDTISFDTLFTTVGSPTATFVVRNRNSKSLRISSVQLSGGEKSPFNVLVDGQYGSYMHDLEVRSKDSIYVLASVCLERNSSDSPVAVRDTLMFNLESGLQQAVILEAHGIDVVFMRGVNIENDTILPAGRYLVYDSLAVSSGATLGISSGTTLYFHDKAFIRVDGTLNAQGTVDSPIVFRGDRTDNMFSYLPYDRIPGQWDGIVISSSSSNNVLRHCDIHSANYGIRVDKGAADDERILIESSKLYNFHGNALELSMARAVVINSLLANSQGNCVKVCGGDVRFIHCTIANFYVWKVRDVALALHNSIEGEPAPLENALFANCIIAGSKDDEVMGYNTAFADSVDCAFNYRFENSFINTPDVADTNFVNVVYDRPDSDSFGKLNFRTIDNGIFLYDFHIAAECAARGVASGYYLDVAPFDVDGNPRPATAADAGCYNFVEIKEE